MASRARLTVTVTAARGSTTVSVSTNGRSVSTPVNTINYVLPNQAVQPNSTPEAYWTSILALVQGSIASH